MVASERSGDLYGAELAKVLRPRLNQVTIREHPENLRDILARLDAATGPAAPLQDLMPPTQELRQ